MAAVREPAGKGAGDVFARLSSVSAADLERHSADQSLRTDAAYQQMRNIKAMLPFLQAVARRPGMATAPEDLREALVRISQGTARATQTLLAFLAPEGGWKPEQHPEAVRAAIHGAVAEAIAVKWALKSGDPDDVLSSIDAEVQALKDTAIHLGSEVALTSADGDAALNFDDAAVRHVSLQMSLMKVSAPVMQAVLGRDAACLPAWTDAEALAVVTNLQDRLLAEAVACIQQHDGVDSKMRTMLLQNAIRATGKTLLPLVSRQLDVCIAAPCDPRVFQKTVSDHLSRAMSVLRDATARAAATAEVATRTQPRIPDPGV